MKKVLNDENIQQKGSNITPERLRFDFNFSRPLTPEEIKAIENVVNGEIAKATPVVCEEMTVEEAADINRNLAELFAKDKDITNENTTVIKMNGEHVLAMNAIDKMYLTNMK